MARLGAAIPYVPRASRRGAFMINVWRGIYRAQAWPRRRKAKRSAKQRQLERDFASAQLAIKWMDPQLVANAMDTFKTSKVLWRDFLTAQLYGTLITMVDQTGKEIFPLQFVRKMSAALDLLGAETGAVLVRGAGIWQTLAPGSAGQRFTSNGPDQIPTWN